MGSKSGERDDLRLNANQGNPASPSQRAAAVPCHALATFSMRSTASRSVAVDDANEKRTKSLPAGPNAAPGIAATPASSSMILQISSAVIQVSETFTQA